MCQADGTLGGLNYQDAPVVARGWIRRLGDAYQLIAGDRHGEVGCGWGVYGVPETFVIDAEGVIRCKHIGPIDRKVLQDVIVPLISELRG